MDIYQIIITHNRSWTIREIIAFAVVFLIAVFLSVILLKWHKIVIVDLYVSASKHGVVTASFIPDIL